MIRALVQGMATGSMPTSATADMGDDVLLRMTASDKKGLSMVTDERAIASQPTLSRFMATLVSDVNLPRLRSAISGSAVKAVHGANGAKEMLSPLIDQAREQLSDNVRVRGDAGFIEPGVLEMLDEKNVPYALWRQVIGRIHELHPLPATK